MKALVQYRQGRLKVYEDLFGPNTLAAAGLAIVPALLFNPSTPLRVLLFLFFWFLATLAGKKNNPFLTLLIILGIVMFNLIVPYGRVLFAIGSFKITQGALIAGIHRAVTLEALIMLSRLAVRPDLRFPGLFGELIGESFRMFALLINQRRHITGKTFIADIDRLLFELSADVPETSGPYSENALNVGVINSAGISCQTAKRRRSPSGTKPVGYVILVVVVILSWAPMILNFLFQKI